jgi:hypothetical protein
MSRKTSTSLAPEKCERVAGIGEMCSRLTTSEGRRNEREDGREPGIISR